LSEDPFLVCVPASEVPEFSGFAERKLFRGDMSYDVRPSSVSLDVRLAVDQSACRFVRRSVAETDETFRQLVAYCLVQNEQGLWLHYRRPLKGGDSRLRGNASIGVGGHVEECDTVGVVSSLSAVVVAAGRELGEELGLTGTDIDIAIKHVGYLQHADTPVARVHLGCIFIVHVNSANVNLSADLPEPQWLTTGELMETLSEQEYWSQVMTRWLVGAEHRSLPCLKRQ